MSEMIAMNTSTRMGHLTLSKNMDKSAQESKRGRDRNEALSGEMIHTTPKNETEVSRGVKIGLFPSHGCIHVDPIERDRLHAAAAFDRGIDLLIHGYNEPLPESMR